MMPQVLLAHVFEAPAVTEPENSAREVDEVRLEALLAEHFDAVYHALRRVGIPMGDIEDCTQEVFIIASGKLPLILPGRERAFLLGVAQRVASHARRRLRRFPSLADDETVQDSLPDSRLRPDEELERQRRQRLFVRIVEKMPEDLSSVFVLFEVEELTMQEIASALDLPSGTVASRLRRAREEFARIATRLAARSGGNHE